MQNIKSENTTIKQPKQIHELGEDFKFVKTLGSGSFGAIELFKYVGNDKKIKEMCNKNNEIGVKFQNTIDMNEANIGTRLLDYALRHPKSSPPFNLIMPYQKDNNIVAILTNPIFFDKSQNANLEDFIVKKLPLLKASSKTNPWSVAFSTGLAISLAQLANEMHRGQANLRKAKVLHLDTACRNFLVAPPELDANGNIVKLNLMISDYGLSGIMNKSRTVDTTPIETKVPLRFIDQKAVSDRSATNSTDFFSLKTTLTEMLGFTAGAKDNTQIIKYPGYDIIPGRFLEKSPYAEDNKALNIYLENVKAMMPQCPVEIRKEVELFITCYESYLINLDNPALDHKERKSRNKESLLTCNEKFIEETFKLKEETLNVLDTLTYSQYNQLADKELIIRRLLTLEVTDSFKNEKTYTKLVNLQSACQALNEIHFSEMFKSHLAHSNQLNSLNLSQRQTQTEFINNLLKLNVSEKFHTKDTYQSFINFQTELQKANAQFIEKELPSLSEIAINIDKVDKSTTEAAYNNINNLLKLYLNQKFFETEPAQKLIKYQELFEKVLNEYKIKENLESNLPPIANLKILDEKGLKDNTLISCQLLSIHVRKQFIESDTYQSLLNYQKTIMLSYVEKHITNLMIELERTTSFKDSNQSSFYNTQKQKYTEALASINQDFNNGNYLNLRQVQKVIQPIDNVINKEIEVREKKKIEMEKLLSNVDEIESKIKDQLRQYKWILFEQDNKSQDPLKIALFQLKNIIEESRHKIKKGVDPKLDDVKKSVAEITNNIQTKIQEKQTQEIKNKITPSLENTSVKNQTEQIESTNSLARKRF